MEAKTTWVQLFCGSWEGLTSRDVDSGKSFGRLYVLLLHA
jgi:hypothetical protein